MQVRRHRPTRTQREKLVINKNKDISSQANQAGHKSPRRKIRGSETVILEAETGDGRALETRRRENQIFLNNISSSLAVKHCLSQH